MVGTQIRFVSDEDAKMESIAAAAAAAAHRQVSGGYPEQQLRLECFKVVVGQGHGFDVNESIRDATALFDFVTGKPKD